MASQERLEYFISAAFKDDGVRQAMQSFAKLNAESAKVVNELDRVSRAGAKAGQAIRDSRTPYAQLGMQFNQFTSQIAGGTSAAVAFSQQIGDVAWVLGQAEGKLGGLGKFLRGPWGIALTLGTSLMAGFAKETDKAAESQANFGDYAIAAIDSVSAKIDNALAPSINAITPIIDAVSPYVVNFVKFVANAVKVTINATAGFVIGMINMIVPYIANIGGIAAEAGIGIANFFIRTVNYIGDSIEAFINKYTNMARGVLSLFGVELPPIKIDIPSFNEIKNTYAGAFKAARAASIEGSRAAMSKDFDLFDLGDIKKRAAARAAERAKDDKDKKGGAKRASKEDEDRNKALEEFIKLTDSLTNKTLPDWQVKLNELSKSYNDLTEAERNNADNIKRFQSGVEAIVGGPIKDAIKQYDELIAKANGVDNSFEIMRQQFVDSIAYAQQMGRDVSVLNEQLALLDQRHSELKMAERNAEIRKSFESIGMSVNDAFKGMLTAGMSWKDGMKGIINAVIDELWRLFVVQQIVGMVKNVLGGFLGGGGGLNMPSVASQVVASDAVLSNIVSNSQAGAVFIPGTNLIDWSKTFDPIGKNANGTPSWKGGLTWVGERGPELVNLPRGAGVIPAHRAAQMGSGGGINITVDARGSADPAAVRAQVQQGILEAAPAIIAAAQQRTVTGLRRPKLGGVMQ